MTTERESRELTQVGAGTIMGDLMRRYWLPAARSSELERDGAPVRLMLLGEKLIAFRDSAGRVDPDEVPADGPIHNTITDRAPQYHIADTPWGTQYGAYRAAGDGGTYWRFASFAFPCWTIVPNGEFGSHVHARAWVPLDDGHTMFFYLWWKRGISSITQPQPAYSDGTPIGGAGRGNKFLPNTPDWFGRWRLAANAGNDWMIDREAQRTKTIYSGIDGIHLQD